MIPEEMERSKVGNSSQKVLSYGALIAQNTYLQKELLKENMRKQRLIEETEVQARVIGQLKNLMKSQTKLKCVCTRGHHQCHINHELCNFVKPKGSFNRSVNIGTSKVNELKNKKENNFRLQ